MMEDTHYLHNIKADTIHHNKGCPRNHKLTGSAHPPCPTEVGVGGKILHRFQYVTRHTDCGPRVVLCNINRRRVQIFQGAGCPLKLHAVPIF